MLLYLLFLLPCYFCVRLYASPAVQVPPITNEPILTFAPGSQERKDVEKVRGGGDIGRGWGTSGGGGGHRERVGRLVSVV